MEKKGRVEKTAFAALTLVVMLFVSNGTQAALTICTGPAAAGTAWQSTVPTGDCAVAGESQKVCKAWLKTCKKVVSDAAKCRNGEVASGAAIAKARCKLSTVADPTQCRVNAIDQAHNLKDQLKNEKVSALDACEAYVATCIFNCEL